MLAGALIRQFFVLRHKALVARAAGAVAYAIAGIASSARRPRAAGAGAAACSGRAGRRRRFARCRRSSPQRCGYATTRRSRTRMSALIRPRITRHAQALYQQAVVLKLMPMNNATQMTDGERAVIGRWYEAGAAER